jgi:hypothetical protein
MKSQMLDISNDYQVVTYFDAHILPCVLFDSQIRLEPDPGAPSGDFAVQVPFRGEHYTSWQ